MTARRLSLLAALAASAVMLTSCAWRETDRRWVSDRRFNQVWEFHQRNHDLAQTRSMLLAQQWRPGEINECIYRIQQLEHAKELYDVRFPPQAEPRAVTGSAFRLGSNGLQR